jgi:putative ABC transport system permease protein
LVEILIFGVLGGALGGFLGYLLSLVLTNIVGGAISNLYFFLRPTPPVWSAGIVLSGMALGSLASLLGGIYPLWEIARSNPLEALRGRTSSRSSLRDARLAAGAGVVVIGCGAAIFLLSGSRVYAAFAATFLFLLGASLLTGVILIQAGPLLKRMLVIIGGLPGRMAAGNIRQNLGRSGVAIAAFMIALSMSIGLDSMIGSFRESLVWWMGTQLRGDLYISTAAETEVPVDFYEELLADKRIDGIDAYRRAEIEFRGKTAYIAAIRASALKRFAAFAWLSGGNENWDDVINGDVVVSESFVRNFDVKPGDTITLDGSRGPTPLRVAASFYDYSTEHGLIIMDRRTYLAIFDDQELNSLSIFMEPDNPDRQHVFEEVRRKALARGLPVFTRKQLYSNVLDVFDATFAVTRSMKIMAVIIAFFGVAGALMTLFIERRREFGILRSLGFSTAQVSAMTLLEALGMGLMSFMISAVVGTVFSYILIKIINLRSFNWTIFFYVRWQPYAIAAATALAASVAASIYPIWKVKKSYPQIQIREE